MTATFDLATDDLTAPEVIADPHRYFGHLRETDPVYWNALARKWIVTRHADVVWLLRNHQLFSNAPNPHPRDPRGVYPPIDESDRELGKDLMGFRSFYKFDRPEHLPMRQAVHRWFTPRAVEKWRAALRAKAQELIDARRVTGTMELNREFATPLPLMTICWMFDVPEADAPRLRDLAVTITRESEGFHRDRVRVGIAALRELVDYFSPLLDARAKDPGDDLISTLVAAERSGVVTRKQCIANIILLLIPSQSLTPPLICSGVLAFIRNPAQWDLLQNDPRGMCAPATEECLRYDSPSKVLGSRVGAQDVELGGKSLRAGDEVWVVGASANRDPRVFPNPDMFDITRSPNPHVAFGEGIHYCLGAALARVETQEALKALAENFPRLHLQGGDVEYLPSHTVRMLRALPVSW